MSSSQVDDLAVVCLSQQIKAHALRLEILMGNPDSKLWTWIPLSVMSKKLKGPRTNPAQNWVSQKNLVFEHVCVCVCVYVYVYVKL